MPIADGGLNTAQTYAALIDTFPNMVFVHQRGRNVLVNARCVELLGYSREEMTSPDFDFRQLVSPECLPVIEAAYWAHAQGQEVAPYEYVIVAKSGRKIDVIQSTSLVQFGGDVAILGVTTDITDRRKMERALRESEARYRTLIELCPDAITLTGLDLKVQMSNTQAARLHGFESAEEMIGLDAVELIAPEHRGRAAINARKTLQTGEVRQVSYEVLRKDGRTVPVELSASIVKDSEGCTSGFLGVVRDATEHHRLLEAKSALTSKILEAQEQERIRVARELHDGVGQMLMVIRMEAEWLATHAPDRAFASRSADLASKTQETLAMVRRMSHGLRPSVLDDLGIGCALESLAAEISRYSGIACEPKVAELADLPIEVATMIYRVAQEALANVVHHSGAKNAFLSLETDDCQLTLVVEDDGRGIDLGASNGPSLGIAHMRERAEMLGGTLAITPREPTGTRLTVQVPSSAHESPG